LSLIEFKNFFESEFEFKSFNKILVLKYKFFLMKG
jgi:hypothetical protein